MDYDGLPLAYRDSQVSRVLDILARVATRDQVATTGVVVPEDTDLALGTGRRLSMAVMFLDLCNFSARPAETPYEQDMLLRMFDLFFTEMIRIAEDYGGTVEKNTGDGLMAYFEDNGGTPPESGCKRAVACALTMMHTNETLLNPIFRNSGLEEFRFRIGIDYGAVTVARIGAARRYGSLVAIGTTANVASKMLDTAGPDDIIIGEKVFWRLPPYWQGFCRINKVPTGWVYARNMAPYRFFRYTGRWNLPY